MLRQELALELTLCFTRVYNQQHGRHKELTEQLYDVTAFEALQACASTMHLPDDYMYYTDENDFQ